MNDDNPCIPNSWIYIYFIKDECVFYDRTMSRTGLGPISAKNRVELLEKRGHEAFYTIGGVFPGAYS